MAKVVKTIGGYLFVFVWALIPAAAIGYVGKCVGEKYAEDTGDWMAKIANKLIE